MSSVAAPSSSGPSSHTKKFVFRGPGCAPLEVHVPELLQAGYSFYTWPSAPVLAWFLWSQRKFLPGKKILEIGSGTALPGILAAKCGASVTLTDSTTLPKSLSHIVHCCEANGLAPGKDIEIAGLTWGLFLGNTFKIGPFDLIVGSDCFYDPAIFEDILVTVAYFLRLRKTTKFLFTYQDRSSDWSIEALLKKWNLKATLIDLNSIGASIGIDFTELMGDHSIHLIEIVAK